MRQFAFILITVFIACNDSLVDVSKAATKTLWVNKDLQIDTLRLDTTFMSVHAQGTILSFDTSGIFKSFANDFYINNDSLNWGEPGIELNYGYWRIAGDRIIVDKQLVERTFLMPGQKLGMKQVDTFHFVNDTLVVNSKTKYTAVTLLSTEIRDFLNRDWSYWQKRNGM